MRSCYFPLKEVIVSRFEHGEDLFLSIKNVVSKFDVKAGMFTVIGAVDSATYGFYNPNTKTYTTRGWKPTKNSSPALEILSCVGNIAMLEEEPIIHAHIMLAGEKGETIGGHLFEGCRVNPTGELTLLKADGILQRKQNDAVNLTLLSI